MLVVAGYGFLLMLPVLVSLLAVSVVQFSLWTWLLPLLSLALATLFLPFGFGNPHVKRLAARPAVDAGSAAERFLVQVTFSPRLHSGLRARMEDADDIGWLSLTEAGLVFRGDAVSLSIPYASIQAMRPHTIGLRGLYLYPCLTLRVAGLPRITALTFAERACCFLPNSRAQARKLAQLIADRVSQQRGGEKH